MRSAHRLLHYLRSVGRWRRRQRELDEELEGYLAMLEEGHRRRGASAAEARRRARLEAGSLEGAKAAVREVWSWGALDACGQDLRYAGRGLRKRPAYSLAVVLTLTLGIGATTAIFGVVRAVLIAPLPYPRPDRLATVWTVYGAAGQERNPASGPELLDLGEQSRLFSAFAGIWSSIGALTGEGDAEQIRVGYVTAGFFEVLGVQPALGRSFEPAEEGSGQLPALVLTDGLWRRRFGGDATIVGQQTLFDGQKTTVVGVLPESFELLFPPDSGVPPTIQAFLPFPWDNRSGARDLSFIRILGRLRPDATFPAAQEELDRIAAALSTDHLRYHQLGLGFRVIPLQADVVRETRPALLALFALVTLMMLGACVNVANLVVGRNAARRQELAMRSALGASRLRIARQLLLECMLLAIGGGVGGVLLARLGLPALLSLRPAGLARFAEVDLDLVVLAFGFSAALLCGLACALAPLIDARRLLASDALREGARQGASRGGTRLRSILVVAEVALSCVLLIGAGLMIRTMIGVLDVDPGFRAEGTLTFQLSLPRGRYPDDQARQAFLTRVETAISGLPGVESVGAVSHLPLDDYPNWYGHYYSDQTPEPERATLMADQRAITPGYLRSLGIRLVQGRTFDGRDTPTSRRVVIVDSDLASRTWPDGDPLGKRLQMESWSDGAFVPEWFEVVGVVEPVRQHALTDRGRPQTYFPHTQAARPVMSLVVRAVSDPHDLVTPITGRLAALDPDLAMAKVRSMGEYLGTAASASRFSSTLATLFGAGALLLASLGIYGVLANAVGERIPEIGLRLALGASRRNIVLQVLSQALWLAAAGLSIGLLLGRLAAGLLGGLLYGVGPGDMATYSGVALVLLAVAALAAFGPALHAAGLDANRALRRA